jgi:hypothetical protein
MAGSPLADGLSLIRYRETEFGLRLRQFAIAIATKISIDVASK